MDLFEFVGKVIFEDVPKIFFEKLPEKTEETFDKVADFIDEILD